MTDRQYVNALVPGTVLDHYRVLDVLGAGGFGITYLAEDLSIGRKLAIKEYLPSEMAARARDGNTVRPLDSTRVEGFAWGLKRFLEEARTLARFEHPNIVTVFGFFEANGTAYYAMRFVDGRTLDRVLAAGKPLAESELESLLHPLLDGLEAVHGAGFLHRDIKPSNIFVRDDGRPVLIDFGAARLALGEHSKTLTAILSPGYAPFEQYHGHGNQGPWTDLYALGATLYRCVTGQVPPEATLRLNAAARNRPDPLVPAAAAAQGQYSAGILAAIDGALKVNEDERPQSVAEFRALLRRPAAAPSTGVAPRPGRVAGAADTLVAGAAAAKSAREAKVERAAGDLPVLAVPPRRRKRLVWIAAAAAAAVVVGAGAIWAYSEYRDSVLHAGRAAEAARKAEAERARAEAERKQSEESRRKAEDDARRRTEEERRKAEEERQRADAERRRLEEERARAEAERRKRAEEEARRRADDEQRKGADEERRRAEEERQRADAERKRVEEERARADAERRKRAEEQARGSAVRGTYLGCFGDNRRAAPTGTAGRDLAGLAFSSPSMTVEGCVKECASRDFKYAGVQYGSWCFCGNRHGNYGAGTCNMPCSGNARQVCGGEWANSVYMIAR